MTLQTQEDEEVAHILSNTDAGDIRTLTYAKLGEEQLMLIGTADGSIIVVDSRSASVLVLCRKVVNFAIASIMIEENIVAIVGESNSVTVYDM